MMVKRQLGKLKKLAAVMAAVTTAMCGVMPEKIQTQAAAKGNVVIENPINADTNLPTDSDLTGEVGDSVSKDASYATISAVAAYVSKHMTSRDSSFSVCYTGSDYDTYGDRGKIKSDLLKKVFEIDTANTSPRTTSARTR